MSELLMRRRGMIAAITNTGVIRYTTTADFPAGEQFWFRNAWDTLNIKVKLDGVILPSPYKATTNGGVHTIEVHFPMNHVPHDVFSANGTTMEGYMDTVELIGPWAKIDYRAFIRNSLRSLILPDTIKEIEQDNICQNSNLTLINGVTNGGTLTLPNIKYWANDNFTAHAAIVAGNIGKLYFPSLEIWGGTDGIYSSPMHQTKPDGGFDIELGPNLKTVYGGVNDRCYIKDLIIHAVTPPTFVITEAQGGDELFFQGHLYGSIKVPAASVDAYKAASGWSTYAEYITAIV